MEKDRYLPVREALREKGFCGECVEDMRTCRDAGKKRILMDIDQKTGNLYGKELIERNIKHCVIFQSKKETMI